MWHSNINWVCECVRLLSVCVCFVFYAGKSLWPFFCIVLLNGDCISRSNVNDWIIRTVKYKKSVRDKEILNETPTVHVTTASSYSDLRACSHQCNRREYGGFLAFRWERVCVMSDIASSSTEKATILLDKKLFFILHRWWLRFIHGVGRKEQSVITIKFTISFRIQRGSRFLVTAYACILRCVLCAYSTSIKLTLSARSSLNIRSHHKHKHKLQRLLLSSPFPIAHSLRSNCYYTDFFFMKR